jgi:hypothetical protein
MVTVRLLPSVLMNSVHSMSDQSIIQRELEVFSGVQIEFGFLRGGQSPVGRRPPRKEFVKGRLRRIIVDAELSPRGCEVLVA